MITNQWYKLLRRWRVWQARRHGVKCASDLRLGAGVDFNLGGSYRQSLRPPGSTGRIEIAPGCWIGQGAVLWAFDGRIALEQSVILGPYVVVYGHGGIEIGERTLVAMHCVIVSSNHAMPPAGVILRDQPDEPKPTKIGRDCWLGAGVKVMAGVTIGEGCIIGAGSVVTRDLPANSIAHGVPAKVQRMRQGA